MSKHDTGQSSSDPFIEMLPWQQPGSPKSVETNTSSGQVATRSGYTAAKTGRAMRWFLSPLRPSLFTTRPVKKNVSSIAYLDGIRGFAAFLVYWQHHQGWAHLGGESNSIFENGYGFNDRHYFAALPGIRLMFTGGHAAVPVFFVLSGYVLSVKHLAYSGDFPKLEENLTSALFRRWIRLHLPVIGTTFVYMTTWHLFGIWTSYPEHQLTYLDEFTNWVKDFLRFSFIFRGDEKPWPIYNVHLWSISYEFKGSIVVYTTLLALSRFRRNARLNIVVGLIFYFVYLVDGWYCAMFLSGMLLCDLDQLARNSNLPEFYGLRAKLDRHKTRIFHVLLVISLYLAGVPSHGHDVEKFKSTPGWYYLSFLKPRAAADAKWFYHFWAATLFVASVRHIYWLRRFFELRFNQYLGHISFGLYLVHGPVLWIIGDRVYSAVGFERDSMNDGVKDWVNLFPLSKSEPLGFEFAFLLPQLLLLPLTLWMAEVTTRLFDEPSVRCAQWAYRLAL